MSRFRAVAAVGATLLAIAAVETALRTAQSGYRIAPILSDPVLHHVHPHNYVFRSYDPKGQFGGHLVRYGADGARVDPARASDEPDRAVRLALMGDSFVEAVQVPFHDTIGGRLQRAAATRASIRNFGVTAYSPILYYLQWRTQVRAWRPTHVLVLLYSNDVEDDRGYDAVATHDAAGLPFSVPGPGDNPVAAALHRSYVARAGILAYRRFEWWRRNRGEAGSVVGGYVEQNPDIAQTTSAVLDALARDIRGDGADLLLSAVPSKARLTHAAGGNDGPEFADKCRAWASSRDIRYLDLVLPFQRAAAEGRRLFFDVDIHLTADGNAVAADAICRAYPSFCS